ncbi:hypothetical protein QAD02_007084 [Eretmocerus hayati]|uniref:Uncharacterized protein n=1 Tax=Eretmocerus hayati TaxID=131215 RepID=A0ACC2N306_9HYME|nr:hypothetical protein QAD02_007084 [Eretmocerus hayati]
MDVTKIKSSTRVRKHRLKEKVAKRLRTELSYSSSDNISSDYSEHSSSDEDEGEQASQDLEDRRQVEILSNSLHSSLEVVELIRIPHSSDHGSSEYSDESESSESNAPDLNINQGPAERFDEISDLRVWAVTCRIAMAHLDPLLRILRQRLLPELPACSKTFLGTGNAQYVIEEMTDADNLPGEFVYLGLKQGLEACVNPDLHANEILEIDLNIDGVKIKKSSQKTMWPGLCRVFYKPMSHIYKPFPVFIFYGNKKPKNVNEFLHKFIEELNLLAVTGITVKGQQFRIKLRIFTGDIPATDFIKCTCGHTGLNGCRRCDTVAVRIDHNTVYLNVGNPRTDESFRNFTDLDHHLTASPLLGLHLLTDMVLQFIIDPMHHEYLGTMNRLFQNWKEGDPRVKLSVVQRDELNRRTELLKKDIPHEFSRKMRPTNHFNDYKATDHRFFAVYCGPIVLKKLLSKKCYEHFLLFHVALRMLSGKDAVEHSRMAKDYLSEFANKSQVLYGLKFSSLNIHYSHHVADDVQYTQCNINDISAFPFESLLGVIKRMLRSPHNTLAQYCRRLFEERTALDQTAQLEKELKVIRVTKDDEVLLVRFKQQYFSSAHPNNTALLKDGTIVKIVRMTRVGQIICARVMAYGVKKSLYKVPCDSSFLNIHEIDDRPLSRNTKGITLQDISTKLVRLSINFAANDPLRTFVLPLLH